MRTTTVGLSAYTMLAIKAKSVKPKANKLEF